MKAALGRFACRMGWHKPGEYRPLNPASANGREAWCVRCKLHLLMDSQGTWFGAPSPLPGCRHTQIEAYSGGWRCRACGYVSWGNV